MLCTERCGHSNDEEATISRPHEAREQCPEADSSTTTTTADQTTSQLSASNTEAEGGCPYIGFKPSSNFLAAQGAALAKRRPIPIRPSLHIG